MQENNVNKEIAELFIKSSTEASGIHKRKRETSGVSQHAFTKHPSADPVFVKQTYEPRELYVFSSMTYKRVVKLRDEKKSSKLMLHFGKLL